MSLIAQSLRRVKPSTTLVLMAKAKEMQAAGKDVVNLTIGEPDFRTPEHICEAARQALADGKTKYTPVNGTPELIRAVQGKFRRENGLSYEPSQIMVSSGGKQVIYNAFMATLNAGDEVIVPAPYWTSYPEMVLLAGGTPVVVECAAAQDFKMLPEQLEQAITKNTKWVVLNSPSNPTGSVYTRAELRALADVLLRHAHVHVLSDDIYEHLVYDGIEFSTMAQVEPALYNRTLTVNGMSKAYAMTGWRIGFCGGAADLIRAMSLVQSQSTTGACTIAQVASETGLNSGNDFLTDWRRIYQARRDLVMARLATVAGLGLVMPHGAFYLYVSVQGTMGKKTAQGKTISSDSDFCDYLLQEHGVCTVPGSAFGLSPFFRISYATAETELEKACTRIAAAVSALT